MVNPLLTISIKVNILASAESHLSRGNKMKKQTRGFWGWVMGGGWASGGSNG
jgi:hypothetical protein